MSLATLAPTGVRDRVGHDTNDIVLVGDPDTMWGDGSDATYAYRLTSEPTNAIMLADVAPFTLGNVTAVTATMRVLLDAGNPDQRIDFWFANLGSNNPVFESGPGVGFSGVGLSGTDPTATVGVIETVSDVLMFSNATGDPMTPEQLTARFAAGFTVGIARRPASGTSALTVYELTFAVEYVGGPPAPLRLHPRSDQYGVGVGRLWPRPGTRQASNRRAGTHL